MFNDAERDTTLCHRQPTPPADRHYVINREIHRCGALLNDKLMDACKTLVDRNIGSANIQSTLLALQPGGFEHAGEDMTQILHNTSHWLACASLQGTMYISDSGHRMISGVLAKHLKELFPDAC